MNMFYPARRSPGSEAGRAESELSDDERKLLRYYAETERIIHRPVRGAVHQHLLHNGYKMRSDDQILLACSLIRHLPKRMFTTYRWGPGKAECGASAEGWRERPALALFHFLNDFAALMLL